MLRYFYISLLWTAISFVVALMLEPSWSVVYTLCILAVLEISLSFDNAIINAEILAKLSLTWRKRFVVFGIPTAVFGTRFLLPVFLLWSTSSESLAGLWHKALSDPVGYGVLLHQSYPIISGFGSGFLLMVGFDFFIKHPSTFSWLSWLEDSRGVGWLRRYPWVMMILIAAVGGWVAYQLKAPWLWVAYLVGMLAQGLLSCLHHKMAGKMPIGVLVKNGLIAFIYLELLDASFSLDGVVGAFTLTENLWMMMLGLGIGAIFVRSLTLLFLDRGILKQWRFLSHGAHYSIVFLAGIMLAKNFCHISEGWIGGVMVGLVSLAILTSR